MKLFTVHEPPGGRHPAEPPELVKEGFCWPAFFFHFVWALYHRLWVAAALILLAVVVLGTILLASGANNAFSWALDIGLGIFIGASANDWRRAKLEKAGWRLVDVVAARTGDEACRRWAEARAVALP